MDTSSDDYPDSVASTIAPGHPSVPSLRDTLDEANNETYYVNLSGASGASIADSRGVGTITDDDPTPSIVINDISVVEGNSGTVEAVFTVTLSAPSGRTVSVKLLDHGPDGIVGD